jgi:hypothetical protein
MMAGLTMVPESERTLPRADLKLRCKFNLASTSKRGVSMKHAMKGALLLVSVLFIPELLDAQSTTTGAIGGTVRDTTGAVLPDVTVEASSPALIEKVRRAKTDEQGNYKIVDLRPGIYVVTFTLTGFASVKREGIELRVGFTAAVNAELRVGAVGDTVTVTPSTPVVDVQNVRTQNVLTAEALDTLPASKTMSGFSTLTLGGSIQTGAGGVQLVDIGGSKGETSSALTIHGMRVVDQRLTYDGMSSNIVSLGGGRRTYFLNQVGIQETVLGTGAAPAEMETGGMMINAVPKDGGNTFRFYSAEYFANNRLQASNIDASLIRQGITAGQAVKEIDDIGVGVGGPLRTDRLWFYLATRKWNSQEYQPGSFFNKATTPFAYVPDMTRQGYQETPAWDVGLRLIWQPAATHKVTLSENYQRACFCYFGVSANLAPDASRLSDFNPNHLVQGTWNHPASNQLLFEAGAGFAHLPVRTRMAYQLFPGAVGISDLATGLIYAGIDPSNTCCGIAGGRVGDNLSNPFNQRLSASYVVGSHAVKIGETLTEGFETTDQQIPQSLSYFFFNGSPVLLKQWALPVISHARTRNLGLFAQDQWTLKRITMNLGVRFDWFQGWVPAGTRAASPFTPEFSHGEVNDVPNFKDLNPRLGVAWDVFGNGKTAIKGNIGRYVSGLGTELADNNDPAQALAESTQRTWQDRNHNFFPDCVLTDLSANGECGPADNLQFGQPYRDRFYDPSVLTGWFNRGYSWQGSVSLQQEVKPRLALNIDYFRTSYGNQTVIHNSLLTPADFTQYCIAAPSDPRLPGGGGNEICGLYDVNPSAFGRVQNLIVNVNRFGTQTETYNGVDISINARFGSGGLFKAGASIGRQITDNCYLNGHPELMPQPPTLVSPIPTGTPRTATYCHVSPPWSAGTQFKISGDYPLRWGIEPSFSLQNLPSAFISATFNAPNSFVAPALGRNLAACPEVGTCTATAPIELIPPSTVFLDRIILLDLRVSKVVAVGRARAKAMLDLYNLFNSNTILNVNATYAPESDAWHRPASIVGGRLVKFGLQFEL